MSQLTSGDDDFNIDDDAFKEGAGINKITEAYSAVFASIIDVATKAKASADSGQTKEIMNNIKIIQNKSSQLSSLVAITKPIIGANGIKFNVFGDTIDDGKTEDDGTGASGENNEPMTEDELIKAIEEIKKNNISLSFSDAVQEIENKEKTDNIVDDGRDHGNLDGADW